ncbi:hypothetical protein AVEN_249002-1 [Araneus ventricosus]|uniref:Uncharacterized protein n=1 Tax=Araneus ventricosus TaxID=182803 RepID=A0A4Y2G7R3_ARAVE|nr:hypothetical protein AVEN_249002-1 [Araneus ventricosus]
MIPIILWQDMAATLFTARLEGRSVAKSAIVMILGVEDCGPRGRALRPSTPSLSYKNFMQNLAEIYSFDVSMTDQFQLFSLLRVGVIVFADEHNFKNAIMTQFNLDELKLRFEAT